MLGYTFGPLDFIWGSGSASGSASGSSGGFHHFPHFHHW
jgi:hypothetical protein